MAALPSYAKILLEGFGEQRESALLRTEFESGPPRQARIKSRVMITRPVQIRLETRADYLSFVIWFNNDIHAGADWFDWADPVTGTTQSVRFDGGGLEAFPVASITGAWVIRGLKMESWGA
jgi:hypothetical protein